jgi:Protein of unknown function (DUF3037)
MTRMGATYAVIRYVPNALREEFVNVGVLLVCPQVAYHGIRILPGFGKDTKARLLENSDGQFVRHALTTLRHSLESGRIASTVGEAGAPEGRLNLAGLSTLQRMHVNDIRFSALRPTATVDPAVTLEQLFNEFVGPLEAVRKSGNINRTAIKREVHKVFNQYDLFGLEGVQEDFVLPVETEPVVDLAYKNHVWHCYQAISFAGDEREVQRNVNAYRQTANDARASNSEVRQAAFAVLAHRPSEVSARVLKSIDSLRVDQIELVEREEFEVLAQHIVQDLRGPSQMTQA